MKLYSLTLKPVDIAAGFCFERIVLLGVSNII